MKVETNTEMDDELKQCLGKVANTIRQLSMDAVERANSGHPGLPLGCAEIGAYLWGHCMHYHAKNPHWLNRDRFILSAGHGCMLLYSCLHLSGYDVSLEDLKNFRQIDSKTPGHPEYNETPGVETTTGPLGQGVASAVGQALGLKLLGQRFNTPEIPLFTAKVFALCGDGCMMEGVCSEASALAGHLKLDNLVLIYDSNKICLDGPLSESCSEDTKQRYLSYGWDVYDVDGHDFDSIDRAVKEIRQHQERPCLVIAHTIIGKGSPNKEGTHKVHGAPLGPEEVAATKAALGLPAEDFYIPQAVQTFFEQKSAVQHHYEEEWNNRFESWKRNYPKLAEEFEKMYTKHLPEDLEKQLMDIEMKASQAGRAASNQVIQKLAELLPQIYGGSADLSCSDKTLIDDEKVVSPGNFNGRNIKYGVREFGMAAAALGLAQTDMITPFCGTFFTFSDYMRNAIRLAALSGVQVIYQFTHDSFLLGEDGPTHQPVEHLMALRAMPKLHVLRPADNNEVKMAWFAALQYQGPSAIILSRQNLPELAATRLPYDQGMARGAYIVKKEKVKPDFTLFATGSEVSLALDVAVALEKLDKDVRVISMPCWELFEKQNMDYKSSIVGGDLGHRVSIEAGVDLGWYKFIGLDGTAICMESFGASAPASELSKRFGFNVESILGAIL